MLLKRLIALSLQIARVEAKGLAAQNTRFGQRLNFSSGSGSRKRRRGDGGSDSGGNTLTDYDAEGWAAGDGTIARWQSKAAMSEVQAVHPASVGADLSRKT